MSISNDILVIGVVVALTFLMWLMLREAFGAKRKFSDRLITFFVYAFLALWSIGFGYGFWWSLISGEEATRTGLSGLQEDARDASQVVAARLDAVRGQLDSVVSWSDSQMTREETSGGSCGKPSGAGKGPLYNARRSVRDRITTMRDGMVRSWLEPVQADVEKLRQAAASLEGGTVEERQKAFEAKASEIRGMARNIAARSNALGTSTANDMRALAGQVSIPPDKAGFSCFDQQLSTLLTQAAAQAEQPAELKLREAVFSEGPAGVANAVKNLWRNIGAYSSSLLGKLTGSTGPTHTGEGEPITGRDLIALLATIGVDLGLLVLAILNPPTGREPRRLKVLATSKSRMPSNAPQWRSGSRTGRRNRPRLGASRISSTTTRRPTSSFPTFTARGEALSKDDTDEQAKLEAEKALAMNQLAGVLSDLDLISWPEDGWPRKSRRDTGPLLVAAEEERAGETSGRGDRWQRHGSHVKCARPGSRQKETDGTPLSEDDKKFMSSPRLRNHGLFSKAERALSVAGWSEDARRDVEIFRVVESDGLTPLLMVLSERCSTKHFRQSSGEQSTCQWTDCVGCNSPRTSLGGVLHRHGLRRCNTRRQVKSRRYCTLRHPID